MGYFFSDSLACVISHPEVMMETDVSVMRSATMSSEQLNERVAYMRLCKHSRTRALEMFTLPFPPQV